MKQALAACGGGGAVNGRAFYGTPPPVSGANTAAPEDQWHVGQGRLLPSTLVDRYAATLAKWFGVADSELTGILPNIGHFGGAGYPVNLGFMLSRYKNSSALRLFHEAWGLVSQ